MTHPLVRKVRLALRDAANPAKAAPMQAYMKSAMPFRGVPGPDQRRLWRALFAVHPLTSFEEWQAVALTLWRDAAYREERYAAIALTDHRAYAGFRRIHSLPMFEEMIVTGAWWDFVDALATHHLGDILRHDRGRMAASMRRWARDPILWKRRAALLCQIGFKQDTDLTLLYDCIEPNLRDRDFFIRKAIGWALRQYARVDPREVCRFVSTHPDLSPLSRREATR